jgi:hypothetical protein
MVGRPVAVVVAVVESPALHYLGWLLHSTVPSLRDRLVGRCHPALLKRLGPQLEPHKCH